MFVLRLLYWWLTGPVTASAGAFGGEIAGATERKNGHPGYPADQADDDGNGGGNGGGTRGAVIGAHGHQPRPIC